MPDDVSVTLIDQGDAFVFGYSKLDVMFGRAPIDAVRIPYREIAKPGVQFRQEQITSIDPETRRVTTDGGTYDADVLVVALGADLDPAATPGLVEGGNEFYSVAGAERVRDLLPSFEGGDVVISILGPFFKCPAAPYECALMLHDYMSKRDAPKPTSIKVMTPMGVPIPISPVASENILDELRDARHRVLPRDRRDEPGPGEPHRGVARREHRRLRPLPRGARARRTAGGGRERPRRRRVDRRRSPDVRDPLPGRLRRRRHHQRAGPAGRRDR